MTDSSALPKPDEIIVLADGSLGRIAWCAGWTWPIGESGPTRLYAQALTADNKLTPTLRVIAARDGLGARFWLAERRTL